MSATTTKATLNMKTKQDFTSAQLRMLAALEENMGSFFYNDSNNRDDSMIYALDNGFTVHAIDCFSGTGATDGRFDRIFSRLVTSVGPENWNTVNRSEAKEMCSYARIQICEKCNHHAFTEPSDSACYECSGCLASFPKSV
jgi:hypothetical protein